MYFFDDESYSVSLSSSGRSEQFDVYKEEQLIKETLKPINLFKLWDSICYRYERGQIPTHIKDELRDLIFEKMEELRLIAKALGGISGE